MVNITNMETRRKIFCESVCECGLFWCFVSWMPFMARKKFTRSKKMNQSHWRKKVWIDRMEKLKRRKSSHGWRNLIGLGLKKDEWLSWWQINWLRKSSNINSNSNNSKTKAATTAATLKGWKDCLETMNLLFLKVKCYLTRKCFCAIDHQWKFLISSTSSRLALCFA